jgi:N6-adenosine-specific RNA methylase IME4
VKPEAVYHIIEQMYPNAKYLELFARQRRQGWEAWGNEL